MADTALMLKGRGERDPEREGRPGSVAMVKMGGGRGVSKGKRGRGKGVERKPESGDVGAEKTKGGDVEHNKGNGCGGR